MGINGLNGVSTAATFAAGLQKRKAELSASGPKTAVATPDAAVVLARLAALVGELQALGCVVKVSASVCVEYGNQ